MISTGHTSADPPIITSDGRVIAIEDAKRQYQQAIDRLNRTTDREISDALMMKRD